MALRTPSGRGKGKGSPYSITELRVPELIPVLGSQPAGNVVLNPAVGCHYFPPGHSYPCCYNFRCLVNRGTMGVNSLPKTVTRQRRGCNLNPGPTAPESSMLSTRLLSDPLQVVNARKEEDSMQTDLGVVRGEC